MVEVGRLNNYNDVYLNITVLPTTVHYIAIKKYLYQVVCRAITANPTFSCEIMLITLSC